MSPGCSTPGSASTDERTALHDAMAHLHRRWVVDALDTYGSLDLSALAAHVVRREEAADASATDSIAVGLYHNHLPKLDSAGFVEFDAEERVAAPGERIETTAARLDATGLALSD
ncbi:DUF7344 domain-containing protein [Halomarina rubra]|uniref:DUF7344 domain-containing protein n=1 Tax=Halomarina rubra TaxID=2071873 RepID=A0ABD6AT04_9EURY|nr:hypothetical protein [Halomarina rubra]